MTELRMTEGERPETLTDQVASRLRGQLAERNIKHKLVTELTGWGKTTVYRKLHGISPLDTNELDALWRLFGISPAFLMTGRRDDETPRPSGPGGSQSHPWESNPRPIHYQDTTSGPSGQLSPVVPLRRTKPRRVEQTPAPGEKIPA
ncbi:MAG: helix-turn-helix transcriptional regulator [Mycobacterium sp.]|nr:helix-turn-helix transcriptional regulator [Mycobacterium sp.]